jgi:small subunit ribosomal protein S2
MAVVTMKQLLEVGLHFGHQVKRWNPKMKDYIYGVRNNIHIVNLQKAVDLIEVAFNFVQGVAAQGKDILFVGRKKQAKDVIKSAADRCGMYYVNERWLGGMLTNFPTMRSRIDRLNKLDQMEQIGSFELLPKKEVLQLNKERGVLRRNLGGIQNMRVLPGALFVVDIKEEHLAIAEAKKLNIPIVALVDTNCDPDLVDYVIPGNDDAIRAVKLIANIMADAVIIAKEGEESLKLSRNEEVLAPNETVVEEVVAAAELPLE